MHSHGLKSRTPAQCCMCMILKVMRLRLLNLQGALVGHFKQFAGSRLGKFPTKVGSDASRFLGGLKRG